VTDELGDVEMQTSGNGVRFSTQLCQDRAEECRTLARQAEAQELRVMLQHIAETWDRIAERLANPD
jgi:hypothetical protein